MGLHNLVSRIDSVLSVLFASSRMDLVRSFQSSCGFDARYNS